VRGQQRVTLSPAFSPYLPPPSISHHLPPVSLPVRFALPHLSSLARLDDARFGGKETTSVLSRTASQSLSADLHTAAHLISLTALSSMAATYMATMLAFELLAKPCDADAVRSAEVGSGQEQQYGADCSYVLLHSSPPPLRAYELPLISEGQRRLFVYS
jgi:hypothetical protein